MLAVLVTGGLTTSVSETSQWIVPIGNFVSGVVGVVVLVDDDVVVVLVVEVVTGAVAVVVVVVLVELVEVLDEELVVVDVVLVVVVPAAASGSRMSRNAWSAVIPALFVDARILQFRKSVSPLFGDGSFGDKQLKRPCGLTPLKGWNP